MPPSSASVDAYNNKYNDFGLMAMNDAWHMPAASTRTDSTQWRHSSINEGID